MGCTSSNQTAVAKESTAPVPTTAATISHDGQQLIPDHFRKWLKTNRPKADEFVLNDVLSTAPPSNEAEDYRNIVGKALDLLADRHDIKSTNKLGKLLQKEISLASPKKVAHTVQILKQTADKLRDGQIQLESEVVAAAETTDETAGTAATDEAAAEVADSKKTKIHSGEPGIPLRDALDKARVLFYKGKQAAIFANPNGGYDVRIVDENDETIHHDGNLLRSIIVTEVKLRPKTTTTSQTPQFVPPPPPSTAPPPIGSTLLDENEITDDFRRSIDAALKGLEAVYQTSSPPSTSEQQQQQQQQQIQKIHVETIKTTRTSSPPPPKVLQCGVTNAPIPRSMSKERTTVVSTEAVPPVVIDSTANLAEIIHQMAEQQKLLAERLAKETSAENEPLLTETDIQPKLVALVDSMSDLMMDAIETTTESQIGNPVPPLGTDTIAKLVNVTTKEDSEGQIERIVREIKEHGEKFESKESLPSITTTAKQPSSYSIGLTSPLSSESLMSTSMTSATAAPVTTKSKLRGENRPKSFIATEESSVKDRYNLNKQISLDELAHLTQTGLSNPHLPTSTTKLGISTSSGKIEEEEQMPVVTSEPLTNIATSISQIIEEHHPILDELSSSSAPTVAAPVVTPVETQTHVKSPTHNVTYTEIIHSESRDGEQSRRFVTESYNEHPSTEDEQTTTLKVVTKSEFTNHPTTGEKIMEQSVQVITVKVRNETIKTTIQQASIPMSSSENETDYERRPVSELVKNFEVAANPSNVNNGN